jgi:DNA polymerase-3 subunit delta
LIVDVSKDELQDDFYANLRSYAKEIAFMPLRGNKLISWIRAEFKKRVKLIKYEAAAMLAEVKEEGPDGLITEIDKLASYVGKRPVVAKGDIEKIIGGPVMRNVFELVDALSRKDAKKSLLISNELLKAKKPVPEILGLIGWQLRRTKKAKELIAKGASGKTAAERCKVPHYHVEKFLREVRLFTRQEIDKGLEGLLEADHGIKTGHLKPQDALEILIIKICTSPDTSITGQPDVPI